MDNRVQGKSVFGEIMESSPCLWCLCIITSVGGLQKWDYSHWFRLHRGGREKSLPR